MYQLILLATWQIHPVFHASLLSPFVETDAHGPNYSRHPPNLIGGEEFYEVEQIWDHQHHGWSRALQYLIKWKGSPESDNTWEPADLVLAPDLLKQYHKHRLLSGIKANWTTLQWPQHPSWILPNDPASSTASFVPPPLLPTNSMTLNHVPVVTKTCLTPLCIAAAHTSPTSTPSSTPSSIKNTTVAIIPEDHLLCQPQICHAATPLPQSHPLHPCPFQCASHPLNQILNASQDILASARMMPFEWVKSPKKVQELLSPPLTPGGSPSLPPLCRTSLLPHLICPQTNSGPLLPDLLPPSRSKMMSIGRRLRGSRLILWHFNKGWTMTTMITSASVHPDTRRTENTFWTSPSPSMMEPNDSPASSSSLMMEGWLDSTARPRERRRHESLSYTPLLTIPLTNPWSHFPPGSAITFGETGPPTPSSGMPSITLMTGDSSLMSTDTTNMTKRTPTSSRSWTSWKQNDKVLSRATPLLKSASSCLNLPKKSSTLLFACHGHHSVGMEKEEPPQVTASLPHLEMRMSPCSRRVM